jgi:hypothetical protein
MHKMRLPTSRNDRLLQAYLPPCTIHADRVVFETPVKTDDPALLHSAVLASFVTQEGQTYSWQDARTLLLPMTQCPPNTDEPSSERATSSVARGSVVKVCRAIYDANPDLERSEAIALAVEQGIHKSTASTQYYRWNKEKDQ